LTKSIGYFLNILKIAAIPNKNNIHILYYTA